MNTAFLKHVFLFLLVTLAIDLIVVQNVTGQSYTQNIIKRTLRLQEKDSTTASQVNIVSKADHTSMDVIVKPDQNKEDYGMRESQDDGQNIPTTKAVKAQIVREKKITGFQALNTEEVTTLNFVCIAPRQTEIESLDSRIHMYKGKETRDLYFHRYTIRSFQRAPMFEYTMRENVAYFYGFVVPFRPNNFFHFTKQIFFPLHYLINDTNTKDSNIKNDVYFKVPLRKYRKSVYAQYLFPSLNIDSEYGRRHNFTHIQHPGGVCYKKAVFSESLHLEFAEKAIAYFYKFLGVNESQCDKQNSIVLIQRKYNRKLVNIDELLKTAIELRFTNVSIVMFEDIPLKEQARVIYCARVLVGVQGAGMQWAYFMKPNSVTIEIAWPHYGWDLYYSAHRSKEEVLAKKISFIPLVTDLVHNVTTCWQNSARAHKLTEKQMSIKPIEKIYQAHKVQQLGKTCNADVDPKDFGNALKTAFRWIKASR